MSTRASALPFVLFATLALAAASAAWAADAVAVIDPVIYEVKAPTNVATRTHMTLAYEGGRIEVHLGPTAGPFPQVNLGFSGAVPRNERDGVMLNEAIRRTSKVEHLIGGVVVEHHRTTVSDLRRAYVASLATLGFQLDGASTDRLWHFSNGTDRLRVNAMPHGSNVVTYIGR